MEFGEEGKAKQLVATGNVLTERTMSGKPTQTATAQSGTAQLMASGGWSQMDLQGNVRLREADRSGQADHVTFVRATQTALLTGKALARDATSETQAPRITLCKPAERFARREVFDRRISRPRGVDRNSRPYRRTFPRTPCREIRKREEPCTLDMLDFGRATR